jgi:hypothetical protein
MIQSFLEWVQNKEELLEETRAHVWARDLDVGAPDESTFKDDQQAGINYWVVNNGTALLKSVIKRDRDGDFKLEKQKNPHDFSLFKIKNIQDDKVEAVRSLQKTWAQGKTKIMNVNSLRDVTDAFEQVAFGNKLPDRYFVHAGNGSGSIDELHQIYLELTKKQAADPMALGGSRAFTNEKGGNDVARNLINQGADEIKFQQWLDWAAKRIRE